MELLWPFVREACAFHSKVATVAGLRSSNPIKRRVYQISGSVDSLLPSTVSSSQFGQKGAMISHGRFSMKVVWRVSVFNDLIDNFSGYVFFWPF